MIKNILLFYASCVTFCLGGLPYPFIPSGNLELKRDYKSVPEQKVLNIINSLKQSACGKRCLQFLQYYASKTNTKICFVYSNDDSGYSYLGNNNAINDDTSIRFIQIPRENNNKPTTIPCCWLEADGLHFMEMSNIKNQTTGMIIHEIHHYCEEVMYATLNKARVEKLREYEIDNSLINGGDETHQQLGCWFIGEFDFLQEAFDRFIFRVYNYYSLQNKLIYNENSQNDASDCNAKLKKTATYLRDHQLDTYFVRPKYYENLNYKPEAANTIVFLQQEDFLLEHFALEVPSDGNDAIWAIMQAMLPPENYLPVEQMLSNDYEKKAMLYWRSEFAKTEGNGINSRFTENHRRIKVEDFKHIALTLKHDIVVIEPGYSKFIINIFNDDGSNYQQDKLPKVDAKTLYIYYNGYNHYQPLLLSSKFDKNISLNEFLDKPQDKLNEFLNDPKNKLNVVFKQKSNDRNKLNENYRIEDVPGDGNCGIYAILRGLNMDANIKNADALRERIFPENHRMRIPRTWLGMENLPLVASYLQNTYQRDLVIVNTRPVNPNITDVIVPDDHIYTRYVNGHWNRYNTFEEALNENSTNNNPPIVLLYTLNHWQAVLPITQTTTVDDSTTKHPEKDV